MSAVARSNMQVIAEPSRAAMVLHPIRNLLLRELDEPASAAELARRLGLPRQKVNYHLRELEQAGFTELVEERKKGNCLERIVCRTARSYLISPEVLGSLGRTPQEVQDRFSSTYLMASAWRMVRDVIVLRRRAQNVGKKLATLTLQADVRFASAKDRHAFTEELANTFAILIAKYHNDNAPDGRAMRFLIGAHPTITKSDEQAAAEEKDHAASKETSDD